MKSFLRLLAVFYLIGAGLHFADLFDLRLQFSSMDLLWKIWIVYLLIFDAAAGIGLWLRKKFGIYLFLAIAVSQLVAYVGFPTVFGSQDALIGFHFVSIVAYVSIWAKDSIFNQKRQEDRMGGLIAFLPWFTVESRMKIGNHILHPIRANKPEFFEQVQRDVINIISRYYNKSDKPINSATLVYKDGANPTDQISDQEIEELFLLSEILAFSALSIREFFSGHDYLNRDNLRLIGQRFVNSEDSPAITNRRRDGETWQGFSKGIFKERCPNNVSTLSKGKIDVDFCNALIRLYASGDPLWDQVYDAILGFNSANTDRQEMRDSAEIVHMCGAFERLFGWSQANVVPGFTTLMASIPAASALKFNRTLGGYVANAGSHKEGWIRDFYKTRNELGHGKTTAGHAKTWDTQEHLLLGSFIFPITLKAFLESKGWYQLSDDDKWRLFRIDYILNLPHVFHRSDPNDPDSFLWNEVRSDSRWDWIAICAATGITTP